MRRAPLALPRKGVAVAVRVGHVPRRRGHRAADGLLVRVVRRRRAGRGRALAAGREHVVLLCVRRRRRVVVRLLRVRVLPGLGRLVRRRDDALAGVLLLLLVLVRLGMRLLGMRLVVLRRRGVRGRRGLPRRLAPGIGCGVAPGRRRREAQGLQVDGDRLAIGTQRLVAFPHQFRIV